MCKVHGRLVKGKMDALMIIIGCELLAIGLNYHQNLSKWSRIEITN
ncbi:MAG: hypothetical protein ACI8Z1_002962 [Candidatus Azotimanducaceae bacterium]|jgi:hypothetical protein